MDGTTHDAMVGLVQKNTELIEAVHGFFGDADRQVGEVARRHAGLSSTFYVDQAVGDDDHPGTPEAPVKSIHAAVALSVPGQRTVIKVRGDYTTTQRIEPWGQNILVESAIGPDWETDYIDGARSELTIGFGSFLEDGTQFARVFGFSIGMASQWNIAGFNVRFPSSAAVNAQHPAASHAAFRRALFPVLSSEDEAAGSAVLRYCNLFIPDDCYATILSQHVGGRFSQIATIEHGDLSGRIHPNVPAGTSRAAAVEYCHCNRPTL